MVVQVLLNISTDKQRYSRCGLCEILRYAMLLQLSDAFYWAFGKQFIGVCGTKASFLSKFDYGLASIACFLIISRIILVVLKRRFY